MGGEHGRCGAWRCHWSAPQPKRARCSQQLAAADCKCACANFSVLLDFYIPALVAVYIYINAYTYIYILFCLYICREWNMGI